ncbi:MAG: 3-oxoacid CoA-transferase, partial [Leptospiraceae bacterium]|nr:3-oxoacid CoA-transferase [Leptospiraceae bacterium]
MFRNLEIYSSIDRMVKKNVEPGSYIHFSSCMSRPNALINALVRVFYGKEGNFTISCTGLHSNANALALSGIVKKAIITFAGDNYPRPAPNRLYSRLFEGKPFELELWSILSLVERLIAGALQLPGIITSSILDSHLATDKVGTSLFLFPNPNQNGISEDISFKRDSSDELSQLAVYGSSLEVLRKHRSIYKKKKEADEEQYLALLSPLSPDYTFVHGTIADDRGNVLLTPPLGEGIWGALAAKKGILLTAERIVPYGTIPPEFVTIPGSRVIGMCEVPYGAHPQSMRISNQMKVPGLQGMETYCDDYDFMVEASEKSGSKDLNERKEWLEKYILCKGGHEEYLKVLGKERLENLKLSSIKEKYKTVHIQVNIKNEPATDSEQMIILTARSIIELVIRKQYKTVLAGIGAAHMAAWTAAKLLEASDFPITTLAELGFYGFVPQSGDIFLFSQLHGNKAEQLSDVTQILGTQVSKDCLGVLGTAQIDLDGNLNSTRLSDGRFLVGSGGANDIASTADCLVVAKAMKGRFVQNVDFITSPGRRVQ